MSAYAYSLMEDGTKRKEAAPDVELFVSVMEGDERDPWSFSDVESQTTVKIVRSSFNGAASREFEVAMLTPRGWHKPTPAAMAIQPSGRGAREALVAIAVEGARDKFKSIRQQFGSAEVAP